MVVVGQWRMLTGSRSSQKQLVGKIFEYPCVCVHGNDLFSYSKMLLFNDSKQPVS